MRLFHYDLRVVSFNVGLIINEIGIFEIKVKKIMKRIELMSFISEFHRYNFEQKKKRKF